MRGSGETVVKNRKIVDSIHHRWNCATAGVQRTDGRLTWKEEWNGTLLVTIAEQNGGFLVQVTI
jgi:hypothetical protein